MIPPVLKIDGPIAGLDPLYVILGIVITVGVLGGVAVIARQVHAMTPKQPTPQQRSQAQKAQQAGAAYDEWTERPQQRRERDSQYYALYGSEPARQGDYVSPRAPPAPAPPGALSGEVVVTLGPSSAAMRPAARPAAGEPPPSPWASPSAFEPPGQQAPRVYAPPRPSIADGPTDDVVAPTHGRRARDVGLPTGQGAEPDPGTPPFERSSVRPGAAPSIRGDAAFSPRASAPAIGAPLPPAPPSPPRISPNTPRTPPSVGRTAFAKPASEQAVVGGAGVGLQEGSDVTPQRKAIRCPKCSTVFPGPAQRPAMVKCPACGTGGMMK